MKYQLLLIFFLGVSLDLNAFTLSQNQQKCNSGIMDSCYSLGRTYGEGVNSNELKALGFYEKACSGNHALSCSLAGNYYYMGGKNIKKNRYRAIRYFEKACNIEKAFCHTIGVALQADIGDGVDAVTANEFYTRSCNAGYGDGCNGLGHNYLLGKLQQRYVIRHRI